MIDIEDITKFCHEGLTMLPGITTLHIVDAREMSNLGDLAPGATVYKIEFRQWTGGVTYKPNKSKAGDSYTIQAKVYVPRMRFMTENLITELVDRKVIVFVKDRNGEDHRLNYAQFASQGDTGAAPPDSNGYEWTFTADDRRKRFFAFVDTIALTGNEVVTGPPDVPDPTPNDPTPGTDEACCITILTSPVATAPPSAGNILNRNKFVRMTNGRQFFIDKNGLSIELGAGTTQYEVVNGDGSITYTLTTDVTDFDPKNFIFARNGVVMVADPSLNAINGFLITGQDMTLPIPLESGEIIQIYRI